MKLTRWPGWAAASSCCFTPNGGTQTAEILVQHADLAMYAAKSDGGNGYRLYQQDMTTAAVARFRLRNDLRDAFEHGDFRLCYQPLLRLSDRTVVGADGTHRDQGGVVGAHCTYLLTKRKVSELVLGNLLGNEHDEHIVG